MLDDPEPGPAGRSNTDRASFAASYSLGFCGHGDHAVSAGASLLSIAFSFASPKILRHFPLGVCASYQGCIFVRCEAFNDFAIGKDAYALLSCAMEEARE